MADVLASFEEGYQNLIKTLPPCAWPTNSKHGQHSYTVCLATHKVLFSCSRVCCILVLLGSPTCLLGQDFRSNGRVGVRALPPRWMGDARVEVLLRQHAFKPKSDVDGKKVIGEDGRSTLGLKCQSMDA